MLFLVVPQRCVFVEPGEQAVGGDSEAFASVDFLTV
jgi:hypothetical protein